MKARSGQQLVQPKPLEKPVLPDKGIFEVPKGYWVIDTSTSEIVGRPGQTVAIEEKTRGRFKIVPIVAGG